jgi:hypothetical protein
MMIHTLRRTTFFVTLFFLATVVQAADFVGPGKCRNCHKAEYEQWANSPHARAFAEGFQQIWHNVENDPACLACHTTNADLEAGSFSHPGVTCESCHGAMVPRHAKKDIEMPLPVTSEICQDCHRKTYQEWQMSQHAQSDIRCFDCHGVHKQSLRANGGDQLCGACHSKRLEDFAHATHQLEGLHCNSCHMPLTAGCEGCVIGDVVVPAHTLFVGAEVCGRCHADMVHSSAQLPELRDQLVEVTHVETLTGGKGAVELYEEVNTLTWMLEAASKKLWSATIAGLLVGLLLGWMFGWYVFAKMRSK